MLVVVEEFWLVVGCQNRLLGSHKVHERRPYYVFIFEVYNEFYQ